MLDVRGGAAQEGVAGGKGRVVGKVEKVAVELERHAPHLREGVLSLEGKKEPIRTADEGASDDGEDFKVRGEFDEGGRVEGQLDPVESEAREG